MAAGYGKRCQACYWTERCERKAVQLVELLRTTRVRDAFTAFVTWLPTQGTPQRAAMRLAKHVGFFESLDDAGDEQWTSEFLLKHFGTAVLRRYELPVRWLQLHLDLVLRAEDKEREADSLRVQKAIATMPEGSVARGLLEEFEQELKNRCDTGRLAQRSMRLAFRPAVALLAEEDSHGGRLPGQAALERYLANTPGQRAAISTFIGFLKTSRGVELQIPAKPAANSAAARKALEAQLASLLEHPLSSKAETQRWMQLALQYFHHLSVKDAKTVCTESTQKLGESGLVLTYQGQEYWIPNRASVDRVTAAFAQRDFIAFHRSSG